MKTNNLIYLLVIVLLSSIHCDVNAQYYWSQNRKIALTPDLSLIHISEPTRPY